MVAAFACITDMVCFAIWYIDGVAKDSLSLMPPAAQTFDVVVASLRVADDASSSSIDSVSLCSGRRATTH